MKDLIKKTAKAVYGNKAFSTNFAPYDPEIIPATTQQHERDIEDRFSEFECRDLLEKFDWFRNLKKFTFKKAIVDPSQTPGFDILLKGVEVGIIERKVESKKKVKFRVGFCLEDKNDIDGYKWGFLPNWFDTAEDAQKFINCYYGKIQDKFTFYKEPTEEKEEKVIENKKPEDDYTW